MNNDGTSQLTPVHFSLIFFTMLSMILGVMAFLNHRELQDARATIEQQSQRIRQLEQDLKAR